MGPASAAEPDPKTASSIAAPALATSTLAATLSAAALATSTLAAALNASGNPPFPRLPQPPPAPARSAHASPTSALPPSATILPAKEATPALPYATLSSAQAAHYVLSLRWVHAHARPQLRCLRHRRGRFTLCLSPKGRRVHRPASAQL